MGYSRVLALFVLLILVIAVATGCGEKATDNSSNAEVETAAGNIVNAEPEAASKRDEACSGKEFIVIIINSSDQPAALMVESEIDIDWNEGNQYIDYEDFALTQEVDSR